MKRTRFLLLVVALVPIAQACGRTETSLGAQYRDDAEPGGASGVGGVAGEGGTAGIIEDAGPDRDAIGDAPDASDADADAEDDAADAGDAGDAGCVVTAPEPTSTGVEGPSCAGGLICAATSCCESFQIPGGSYPMGRSDGGSDAYGAGAANEQPEHTVSVSPFYLDRFEVTVGRLRKFVDAYDGTSPADGSGAHPAIPGSGWQLAWNPTLPASQAQLEATLTCAPGLSTWTAIPGPNEAMPTNCVTWYVAFAFCAWDGGRLPTEAEWEKVAAGAGQNRLFPWGPEAPEPCRAGFGGVSPHAEVGSRPAGAGRWGHEDLGGGEWEWVLDYWDVGFYSAVGQVCNDCANLTPNTWRVIRGGAWSTFEPERLRGAFRSFVQPGQSPGNVGFRCAR